MCSTGINAVQIYPISRFSVYQFRVVLVFIHRSASCLMSSFDELMSSFDEFAAAGKYVGNRPIKLRKSAWQDRQIDIVKKKEKEKKRLGFR